MINLKAQYLRIKPEIDEAISSVLNSTQFIKGPIVKEFEQNLANYLDVNHVISCANGTDALQIALMSLNLSPGDEVIVPSFTYVATAEVIALLGLEPVMVDVDVETFNVIPENILEAITSKTKVIIPVHLFGQSCEMKKIMTIANEHELYVIEDNAQAIGSDYQNSDGSINKTGTLGHIGCTSFFPSKNLGCYGDGGALFSNDEILSKKIRMIANHGQNKKYHHEIVGCNSRLDSIQAAVLNVKLKYLDEYNSVRFNRAEYYTSQLRNLDYCITPKLNKFSSHVFHQYTMQIKDGKRNNLQKYLSDFDIPSAIYYPIPLYKQNAYKTSDTTIHHKNTEYLCGSVLSLPIDSEITYEQQDKIIEHLKAYR